MRFAEFAAMKDIANDLIKVTILISSKSEISGRTIVYRQSTPWKVNILAEFISKWVSQSKIYRRGYAAMRRPYGCPTMRCRKWTSVCVKCSSQKMPKWGASCFRCGYMRRVVQKCKTQLEARRNRSIQNKTRSNAVRNTQIKIVSM